MAALGGFFLFLRPRRKRRQREEQAQLAEAKTVAQEDLLALNQAIMRPKKWLPCTGNVGAPRPAND